MIEITVRVKDSEKTLSEKHLHYVTAESGPFFVGHECKDLKDYVESTIGKFKGEPEDVLVKINYTW